MKVQTSRRVTCPRCETPVTGDFKFCPSCAYRLRPGEPALEEPAPSSSRLGTALLFLGAGALLAGLVGFGVLLFGERGTPHPTPTSSPVLRRALTVRDIPEMLVSLPEGERWIDLVKIPIEPFRMMRFEVTRGQWAEFLRDLEKNPDHVPQLLRGWWNTQDPDLGAHLQSYVRAWWSQVAAHLEATQRPVDMPPELVVWERVREKVGDEPPKEVVRTSPLDERYGLLCLVPPSWIDVTTFNDFTWRMPHEAQGAILPENLPVSEISWFDAVAFSTWASERLGLDLRLPTPLEWTQAARAGRKVEYPWGDEPLVFACNSANYGKPRPLAVDFVYGEHPGYTPEGIYAMAGNVGEWTHPGRTAEGHEGWEAAWYGGSFRRNLDDCTVFSQVTEWKGDRFDDVGFRLRAPAR
jgi:formylglycine-generating enzyme required for sulfatase activity